MICQDYPYMDIHIWKSIYGDPYMEIHKCISMYAYPYRSIYRYQYKHIHIYISEGIYMHGAPLEICIIDFFIILDPIILCYSTVSQ